MISIVIVDYKALPETLDYISKVLYNFVCERELHFIIVDNDSDSKIENKLGILNQRLTFTNEIGNNTFVYIINNCQVVYCFTGENLGYGKGNNRGAEISKALFSDKYLIFSNNDIDFPKKFDWKNIEVIFDKNPSIGIVGPDIIGPTGLYQNPGSKPSVFKTLFLKCWKNLLGPLAISKKATVPSTSCYAYWVTGSFFVTRSDYFFEAGMFDTNTFLFGEEIILSERMKSKGYKVYFCKENSIIHNEQVSLKKSGQYEKRMLVSYESEKYYFKTYRTVWKIVFVFSDINFFIYRLFLNLKLKLKQVIKKNENTAI